MTRTFNHSILETIQQRWSARAIDPAPVPEDDVRAVIEAARFAPSCYNEQPWRYLIAQDQPALDTLRAFLSESNRKWAGKAPVLMLVLALNLFERNQQPNRWNQFDTGTSWGFLQLEAWRRGYVTHAMAGFDQDRARKTLHIPGHYDILCMVAMGRHGRPEDLDPLFQAKEQPNTRRDLDSVMLKPDAFLKTDAV